MAVVRRAWLVSRPSGAASTNCTLAAMTSGPAMVATARASPCEPGGGWLPSRAAVSPMAPVSAPAASCHCPASPGDTLAATAATAQATQSP